MNTKKPVSTWKGKRMTTDKKDIYERAKGLLGADVGLIARALQSAFEDGVEAELKRREDPV